MSRSRPATVALMCILLLIGGECARIQDTAAKTNAAIGLLSHGRRSKVRGFWSGGGDVCRTSYNKDASAAVFRYFQKVQKMTDLTAHLEAHPFKLESFPKWLELRRRWQKFESCAAMLSEDDDIPIALKTAMSTGESKLETNIAKPMEMVLRVAQKRNVFRKFGDIGTCQYNPTALDIESCLESTTPKDEMRKQLFGSECSESGAQAYTKRLGKQERAMLERVTSQLTLLIELRHLADELETAKAEGNETGVDTEAALRQANFFFSSLVSNWQATMRGSTKVFGKHNTRAAASTDEPTIPITAMQVEGQGDAVIQSALLEMMAQRATGSQHADEADGSNLTGGSIFSRRSGKGRRKKRGSGRNLREATSAPPAQRTLRETANGADFSKFASQASTSEPQTELTLREEAKGADYSKFAKEGGPEYDPEKANDPLRLKKVALQTFDEATYEERALKQKNQRIKAGIKLTFNLLLSLIIIGGIGYLASVVVGALATIWPFLEPVVQLFQSLFSVLGTVFGAIAGLFR